MNSYYEKFLATGEVKCIDEEIPFDLPFGWEWCRMGSIGDWGAGATPAKGNSDYYGGNILWLRTGELNNGVVYDTEIKITEKALQECSLRLNKAGDVLIAMYGATIGKVAIAGNEMTSNQACCACTPFGVFNYYLFYYLMGSQMDFIKKGEGGAQPNISREKLISHLMPIPPLNEQYRIVKQIQKILPLIEMYSASQDTQDKLNAEINEKLKKSALTDSVIFKGDDNKYWEKVGKGLRCIDDEIHFEIPASWQWVRIKDIFQINPKNIADDNCISAFIPMEKICATYGSEFSYDEVQWKTIKTGYTHFADGDVVFAKITPCFQNRKSVIFIGLPNGIGAGSTELKVMRPYGETINRWYLLYFLKSPYFIDEAQFKGTANQQRIITGYLENKFFPLPPKSEQDRIVEQIKQLASIMSR